MSVALGCRVSGFILNPKVRTPRGVASCLTLPPARGLASGGLVDCHNV